MRNLAIWCSVVLFFTFSTPAATLTVTPITWDIVGLDSNNVNVGPNQYLVGVRVTNTDTVTASNVTANFIWDSSNSYINIHTGSSSTLSVSSLAAGASTDFYFNVDITRNASAYFTARQYHINVTNTGGATVSSPSGRQIYVQKIISQNRNGVNSMTGPTTVYVGGTYQYTVNYFTATGGYDELQAFANFPNILFQVLSVSTTYSAPTGGTNDKIWADAGGWDSDPTSPSYQTVIGPTNYAGGKAGGNPIVSVYTIKVLGPGTATITNSINDHSGGSFHYNADYGTGVNTLTVTAVDPQCDLSITNTVDNPTQIIGNNVTFTVTLSNTITPNVDASGIQVTDLLPAGYQYVSSSPAIGTYDSTTGIWTVGSLAHNTSTTLTITAKVVLAGLSSDPTMLTTASITAADQPDPVTSNNSASVGVGPPYPSAALSVASSSESSTSGTNVTIGEIVRYRLAYVLPEGSSTNVQFVHTLPSNMMYEGNPKVAFVSTISNTFTVKYNETVAFSNSAYSATGGTGGTGSFTGVPKFVNNNNGNAQFSVGDLVLVQGQADARQNGIYYVSSTSGSNVNMERAHSPTASFGYDTNSQINNGDIAKVTTAQTSGPAGSFQLQAYVQSTTTQTAPVLNSTDLKYTSVSNQGITSSTLSGSGLDVNGDETTLSTITPSLAMASGAPAVGATGALTFSFGNLTNPDSDTNKEFVLLEFNVLVNNSGTRPSTGNVAGNTLDNSFVAKINGTTQATSNTCTVTVVEPALPSANATKTVSSTQAGSGGSVTYTLNYAFSAASNTTTAYNVVISDTLPAGLTPSPAFPGGITVTTAGGVATPDLSASTSNTLNIKIASVPPGGTIQVVYSCTVTATSTDTTTLTYSSLPGGTGTSPNSTGTTTPGASGAATGGRDGSASLTIDDYKVTNSTTVTVVPAADLQVTNTISDVTNPGDVTTVNGVVIALPNVGDTMNYHIVLTNNGPGTATTSTQSITVSNVLPAGLSFVSATPSAGTSVSTSGGTTTWTIPSAINSGSSVTLDIQATVAATDTEVDLVQITHSDVFDPVSRNNKAYASECPAEAELAVTNVVDNSSPSVGQNVTFTITLTDNGPNNATNVTVANVLPAGLTYVSSTASAGTSFNSGTGVWTVGSISTSTTATPNIATLTVTATVATSGTLTDTASVSHSDQYDSISSNNSASASLTAVPVATNDSYSTTAGTALTVAANGVLSNDLGAGLTVNGVVANPTKGTVSLNSDGSFTYTPNAGFSGTDTFTYNVKDSAGTLSNTATVTVTVTPVANDDSYSGVANSTLTVAVNGVLANDAGTSLITNSVVSNPAHGVVSLNANGSFSYTPNAGFSGTDSFTYNDKDSSGNVSNTATVTLVITSSAVADLTIAKSHSGTFKQGDSADTYTITVTDSGSGSTDGSTVTVTDTLPTGLTPVSAAGTGWGFSTSGQTVTATRSDVLASGSSYPDITITVSVSNTAPASVTNSASVSGGGEVNTGNDSASDVTPITQRADLSLVKTVNNATPNTGDQVQFTISLSNAGPADATNVAVTDLLPTGLSYVSSTVSQGTYNSGTGLWTIGSVSNGANATLTITALVTGTGTMTNTASITGADQDDPNTGNNSDSASVSTQSSDLSVTKTVDDPTPNVGQQVTFTITVSNAGPSDATNVAVTDALPAGLNYVSSSASVGSYTSGTGVWSVGTVNNGTNATLTVTAIVATAGAMTNTASVTADQNDPNSGNNSASASVTTQSADLSVTKTVDNATPNVGQQVTFTITVNNAGPDAATSVAVNDLLPVGLTYVSSSASVGNYTSGTGVWSVGAVNNGTNATLTVTATVASAGTMTNTAGVTADQNDPNSGNNSASASVTTQSADLSVTKTVDNATPNVGQQVTFTITVSNAGPDAATSVAVNDLLPVGLTYVSSSASVGSYVSSTGIWTVGTVSNGASATLTVTAIVASAGTMTNTASVTADQNDPNTGDNSASASVTTPSADLSVTKTVDNAMPNVGQQVTFTITVSNAGPDAATGVAVNDLLPAGLTYVSSTASQGIYNSGTGIWTVNTINNGANATLAVTATVASAGTMTNTATITAADQNDPNTSNNSDSATVSTQSADLSLTKTVDVATPNVGQQVTFTITVSNTGPDNATNVSVNDLLPAGLTYVSSAVSQGAYNSGTGIWTVNTVNNGASATLTVTAAVASTAAMTNTASVSADQNDPNTGNNTGSATVTPQSADLSLTKTVNNATPNVGQQVTFTITVNNGGPDTATNVGVTDLLPAGLTYVSSTVSQGTYSSVTGIWTVGTISNAASVTLTVTATVSAGTMTNTATITAADQNDPNSANNSASATVSTQSADLSVTKTVNNATPNVGQQVTFTVTVSNAGPDTATNVAVTDLLPAGLSYVSSLASQGTYANGTGVWTVGTISNGSNATLAVTATVSSIGTLTNTATITAADQADPNGTNNSASASVTPQTADLSVTKTVNNPTPNVGQQITFTITLTNAGPDAATNVAVTDLLPAGLTYVSSLVSQGSYSSGTGIWTVGTVNNGAAATLSVTATVASAGTMTNTAAVTAVDQADPAPGNNSDSATVSTLSADLAVTVSADKPSVHVGQQVTFTVTVVNNGPDDATNVAITDLLPAGETFVSSNVSQGTYNSTTGVWTLGSSSVGSTATLTITTLWSVPGTKTDTASVSASDQADPVLSNNSASVTVAGAPSADLSIVKTVDQANPIIGQNVTFTIQVSNAGPNDATGVQVTDLLPAGLTFVSATPSQGAYAADTGIWAVGSVNNGATATLSMVATVIVNSTISNIAQVTASNQFDPNVANNISSATLTPILPSLFINMTVDDPTPVIGEIVTFTITVTNNGQNDISDLIVQNQLPAGLQFVSANPLQGTFDSTTSLWDAGALPSGGTVTLLISATVMTTGSFTDTATITTPSLDKISALSGGALPPGITVTSSAVTTTATAMTTSCFGASINLARSNRDTLYFSSSVPLPTSFNPAGQAISFSLAGFNYSCVLNQQGQLRSGTKLVQLRRDKVNGWIVTLRVTKDNLKQIQGVVNENVTKRTLSNLVFRVNLDGKVFASRTSATYSAIRNLKGVLSK